MRRKIAETNALGYYTLFAYCNCGSLESVSDAMGNTNYFFYDNAGRLLELTGRAVVKRQGADIRLPMWV